MLGWIHIDRKLLEWEWHDEPNMVALWVYLLLSANFEPKQWRGIVIDRGQLVTGRKALAEATGLTERQVRTCMARLVNAQQIAIKPTNKYTLVTICKYDSYQVTAEDLRPTNAQQNVQPTPTTKEIKNNNILTTPRAYMCEEAKQSLSVTSQWSEQVCMKCAITPDQYPAKVAEFISEMECQMKTWESENDMRSHFFNWLRLNMKGCKPVTAKGCKPSNEELERKSEELHRQFEESKAKAKPMPEALARRLGLKN